jgi:hypothetical protein
VHLVVLRLDMFIAVANAYLASIGGAASSLRARHLITIDDLVRDQSSL